MIGRSEAEYAVWQILRYIGEDPTREGLKDTPARVVRSYSELFAGYGMNPKDVLTVFEDGTCDEMVLVKDIEFTSFCEHHMLPFTGKAHVGYVPNGRIVGLSKIGRVVDVFAQRLQVQERLTSQITQALMGEPLLPKGVGCVIEATHSCMSCRGVKKQQAVTITSDLQGVFREDARARAEFLSLIRDK
jgi:GTP cyclohydrolase IA